MITEITSFKNFLFETSDARYVDVVLINFSFSDLTYVASLSLPLPSAHPRVIAALTRRLSFSEGSLSRLFFIILVFSFLLCLAIG